MTPRTLFLFLMATGLLAQSPVEVYGTLNLTLTHDTGLLPLGIRTPGQEKGDLWDMDERTTQLGLRIKPFDVDGLKLTGRLEADLKGGTANSPSPRVRHAYFAIGDVAGQWELLAGRTNEVIAPFRADSINFPAENWPGDIGSRRTQLRFSWFEPLGTPDRRLALRLAATTLRQPLEDSTGNNSEVVQIPTLEARAALEFPLSGQPAELGLWGHQGSKHHPAHDGLPGGDVRTNSLGVDVRLPLGRRWTFTTEFWQGEVGDSYPPLAELATLTYADAVRSVGGWGTLTFSPVEAWRFNLGLGILDPENRGLKPGQRDRLESGFLNGFWTWRKRFEVGLELSRWRSTFQGTTGSNDDLRVQVSLSYSF